MIELLRRNPLLALLAALCVGLAAIVAVELATLRTTPPPSDARKGSPPDAKLLPPLAAASPEAAYPEIAARPLWIPTRRPAPPVATATQQAFVRGQFVLQGVIMAGNTRIAMLKEKASGRIHRVELGRDVNGLHVAEVEPERVTLTQGGEREVIDLRVQRGPGAPQPATAGVQQSAPSPGQGAAAMAAGVPNRSGPFTPPPVSPAPGGVPLIPPGPMPPSAMPPSTPTPASPANPAATAAPQQSAAPMTPEELLARRRARRNQPSE